MKIRRIDFVGIVLLFAMAVAQCDMVSDPYGDQQGPTGPGDEQYNDTVYNDTNTVTRKILMEEFTGHKCPNCPAGQEVAAQLHYDNPLNFNVISIHNSGSFSRPDPPDYPNDFQTPIGESIRSHFKVGFFPSAVINRKEYNSSFVVPMHAWSTVVNGYLNDPAYMQPRFSLKLENIYNTNDRSLRVRPTIETLKSVSGDVAIICYIAENKIIAPQEDGRQSPAYIPDYEHNHLLRSGFPNNGEGKTIFNSPQVGEVYEATTFDLELTTTISNDWIVENCEVHVIIVSIETEEILQSDVVPLTNI